MKAAFFASIAVSLAACTALAQQPNEPIRSVKVGKNRELRVNDKPFFPIMSWLQSPSRYPQLKSLGMNTFVGNHQNRPTAAEMGDLARKAGGYAVPHFDVQGIGHAAILGWIQNDEPDLSHQVSDAKVTAAPALRVNSSTPLWKIVDGVTHSWSVLDPLEGASFTVELPRPVTVKSLAVWLTVSEGLSLPKEMVFLGDGREILRTAVAAKRGQQKFDLPREATFQKLEVQVPSVVAAKNLWGSISEIEGFDAAGKNVLLHAPKEQVRMTPDEVVAAYRRAKAADPSRPVFMTLTGRFLPQFAKFNEEECKRLYPAYMPGADVVGFDIYPIFGWSKPEWLFYVSDGTRELVRMAGPRPVYAWIETHKGTDNIKYENQKDVLPRHTRAEVWMAIIEGATAIGYFTHAWRPEFTEFAPTEEMRRELLRLNSQITRLAPAILAAPQANVQFSLEGSVHGHVKATEHEGAVYVFAQNIDMKDRSAKGSIVLPGLREGAKIEVIDEGRTLQASVGGFSDNFAPLEEHIYRVVLK